MKLSILYQAHCPMCGETRIISKERYDADNEKCSCELIPRNWSLACARLGATPIEWTNGTPMLNGKPLC